MSSTDPTITPEPDHRYVVIIAGGAGTRLWPISRKDRPKQFQAFTNDRTLLQNMAGFVAQAIPMDHVFVMATPDFNPIIAEQLPNLPVENILFEPARRDTGPAATLAMIQVRQRDPQAVVAMLWSDHVIQQPEIFATMLEACFAAAKEYPEAMVSVGANPTSPDTGLGYIQMQHEVARYNDLPVFKVRRFVEKPELAEARRFLASWDYLWNVGYNVMEAGSFLAELKKAQPELASLLEQLEQAQDLAQIAELYSQLPKISLDYLLVQKLPLQLVVPGDLGWSDIGNWNTLHDVLKEQRGSDLVTRGVVRAIESKNSLVFAKDRPIALVGVEDLIIVDDGDTLLVMGKAAAQSLKKMTTQLESDNPELL